MSGLRTPRKKKMEHLKYQILEDRIERLEKKLIEMSEELAQQRQLNEQLSHIVQNLQSQMSLRKNPQDST
jgi:TolA-binding protein